MAKILNTPQISMEQEECKNLENSTKMEELEDLIKQDCQLSNDVHLAGNIKLAKKFSELQTILLIGVTGMLGPYVLRDLCERPQIKKIYCLIRKFKDQTGLQRLKERLETTGIIEEIDFSKILCISGDICDQNLGLTSDEYKTLSERIDAVVHLGVKADYTGEYSKEPGKDVVRAVNVIGTSNILKFVVNKYLKCVFVASSLVCSFTSLASIRFSEDWQDPGTFDEVNWNFGYRISRFISEQLLKQAVNLGIPVKVFRFGIFGGDSKTGKCDYDTNQYSLGLLTIFKLGYLPDLPIPPPILPIDVYSKLSLEVFFNPEAPPDVYNVCKSSLPTVKSLTHIPNHFDINVKTVSIRKFIGKVRKFKNEPLPIADLQEFYFNRGENVFKDLLTSRLFKSYKKMLEGRDFVFENYKMAKFIPNIDDVDNTEASIKRDIQFLMGSRAFEKYGLV